MQMHRKWHFSHSRTNARQAIHERHSTPKLKDPVQRLRVPIVLTDPLWHSRGSESVSHDSTKRQRPASYFTRALTLSNHFWLSSKINSASCVPHTDLVCELCQSLIRFSTIPPTPSLKCTTHLPLHQVYISSASGAWPARTKPWKAGLLPAQLASDVTPINQPGVVTSPIVTLLRRGFLSVCHGISLE